MHGKPVTALEQLPPETLADVTWAAVSAPRAELSSLLGLRSELTDWAADAFGFPGALESEKRKADWNTELGLQLLQRLGEHAEGRHPNVHAWLASALVPHLVVHRWGWPETGRDGAVPSSPRKWSRFGMGLRNGLRLALYRVQVLGEDVARNANEQEFQDVLERPAFGNDPRVARTILARLIELHEDPRSSYGKAGLGRTAHCAAALPRLRTLNVLRPLAFLDERDIVDAVDRCVEAAVDYD